MYEIGFDVLISGRTRIARRWPLQTKFRRRCRRNRDRGRATFLAVSLLLLLLFFFWKFALQAQAEPEVRFLITPKPCKAAPGASRALRWIYQSALRAMPLQHRCDRAHSLHVVMAPLLTGSLTFVATIPFARNYTAPLREDEDQRYRGTHSETILFGCGGCPPFFVICFGTAIFLCPLHPCSLDVLLYLFPPFFSLSFRRRITQ